METLFEAPKPKNTVSKASTGRIVPHILKSRGSPMKAFASFAFHPTNVRFETQESSEEVILFLRQHVILLIPWLLVGALLLFVPPIVFPLLAHYLPAPVLLPAGHVIVISVFWYVAVFGFILTSVIRWYFNIFIVTNERIVDIDFINLLYKEFSEAKIERVQDISYQTKGIFGTLFNFGNVLIQTAGEVPNFIFESVPQPAKVVDTISDTVKEITTQDL